MAGEVTDRLFAERHNMGVLIAINDFGTGNSSPRYLHGYFNGRPMPMTEFASQYLLQPDAGQAVLEIREEFVLAD
ncbi:MAG TPA: hypothetical protein VJY31_11155 [Buttiauxella sp.]|nr:hypothetical protein [Buttiauxella sp.]